MVPEANDVQETASSPTNGADDKNRTQRHPRWTRQETLVLIEGKKIAENRGRRGRKCGPVLGSDRLEPKWDYVSTYCKRHGVNRGPVQCRKRWSNLVCDFKKIKAWESQVKKQDSESFWVMRNDLRKEKKLPGFFDSEVYDVLDGRALNAEVFPLALVAVSGDLKDVDGMGMVGEEEADEEEEEEEEEVDGVFDSCRTVENGLFSDFEQLGNETSPDKETVLQQSSTKTIPGSTPISGTTKTKKQGSNFCSGSMSQEGWKRRRLSLHGCVDNNLEEHLIKVLERNSNMLNAEIEAHNMNCKLDRDQRKDQCDSLVAALSKITDALVRIADKFMTKGHDGI